jgi:hypothetical protein
MDIFFRILVVVIVIQVNSFNKLKRGIEEKAKRRDLFLIF